MTKRSKPRRLRLRIYRGPASVAARVPPGELLLEFFTDRQLFEWRAQGKDYQSYHYLWYYELEAQRAANQSTLLESLSTVPGRTIDVSGWGRAPVSILRHPAVMYWKHEMARRPVHPTFAVDPLADRMTA
jgi:hypothetical protein